MKKLVSVRQLVFILIVCMLTLKVLYLPSLLAKDIGRDAYIFVTLFLLFDFAVLVFFLIIFNKNPDLSFYEIVKRIFGTVIAKIIMFIFFAFFFLKCWAIFQTNFNYLNENLYTNLNWFTFSVPILVAVLYMSKFGVNAAARVAEICVPIVILGFLLSFGVGAFRADYSNLLPICENGFFNLLPKSVKFSFWFGDYIIFIVFFGNIKQEKKLNLKILLPIIISIFLVAVFIAITYSVYSYNMVCHSNAISDMLQIIQTSSDIGSFDWILVLVWDIALFLFFTFNSLGAFYCFRQVAFKKKQLLSISLILIAIFLICLFTNFDIHNGVIFVQNYLSYILLVPQYLLPILIFICSFKLKRRKNAQISLEK